jgi:hypothetical protein
VTSEPPSARRRRLARHAARRANTLVLVTAILVLLVILATAFLVRSQSGRAQATAEQRATGRSHRVESIAADIAQHVADALFVRRIDGNSMPSQMAANQLTGLGPANGQFVARSDYPRLPPLPLAIRYEVDYFDLLRNRDGSSGSDLVLDGYNFAPFATVPFTNWPDRYGVIGPGGFNDVTVLGEGNPVGNPGFGDSRWLASTEPVRALTVSQYATEGVLASPPAALPPRLDLNNTSATRAWSNLALEAGLPVLSPEGLGFSHWPHLSWIATAENGFRLCWDIEDVEANWDHLGRVSQTPQNPTDRDRAVAGELNLGVPYEQWHAHLPPLPLAVDGKDARGYLVVNQLDWINRRNNWFNAVGPPFPNVAPHQQVSQAFPAGGLPNFIQLSALGPPADEFKPNTSRGLIAKTLADADGDGWTDSFWFVSPASSDRSTRQLVAVRITDNSALLNVNVATRFERTNSTGLTPSDVALATRRESYNANASSGLDAAWRDPPVGFLNSPDNDPEWRAAGLPPSLPAEPPFQGPQAPDGRSLVYAVPPDRPSPIIRGGVDVGFAPERWEGFQTQPSAAQMGTYQPSVLRVLGLITEGAPGSTSAVLPLFDASAPPPLGFGLTPAAGSGVYGGYFALSRRADRLTYFKAMANNGELVDPITASRIATLTPFGSDDEIELRTGGGLNSPQTVSRLESALSAGWVRDSVTTTVADRGAAASVASDEIAWGQLLRSARSREETSRFLGPDDPRVQDWRARRAWEPGAAFAPSSGTELLLDHRRKLTTISGARNEMLPPRLWSVIDHTAPGVSDLDVTKVWPAFVGRGLDYDGDGEPDDVTGDGAFDAADDLAPYDPNIMYPDPGSPFIGPGPSNPFGRSIRDTDNNGRIDRSDFENARKRFLEDNMKIDLREPNDVPEAPVGGTLRPASRLEIGLRNREFLFDVQRVLRRTLTDESVPDAVATSYFSRPEDLDAERQEALVATRMLSASMAANILSWRDGERQVALPNSTISLVVDPPLHPAQMVPLPRDVAPIGPPVEPDPFQNSGFIGVEKQPFLMEVFVAFVYPPTEVDPNLANACIPPAQCGPIGEFETTLPACVTLGNQQFVAFDPNDPETFPAIVFVAQLANPWNTPVSLADLKLVINTEGAAQKQQFAFRNSPYGRAVELGPCTPEEPRTAIVYAVPATFPNGDPFPRLAWLDYLDIGAPVATDADRDGIIDADEPDVAVVGQPATGDFIPDANAIFEPAMGPLRVRHARRGTLYFDATPFLSQVPGNWQPRDIDDDGEPCPCGTGTYGPEVADVRRIGPPNQGESYIELRREFFAGTPSGELDPPGEGRVTEIVVDRFDNEMARYRRGGQLPVVPTLRDRVNRLFAPIPGGFQPPAPQVACDNGQVQVDGIRIGQADAYVAWARASRQWLFDTSAPGSPGRGIISPDERTPRFAFARTTSAVVSNRNTQNAVVNGQIVNNVLGDIILFGDLAQGGVGGNVPDGYSQGVTADNPDNAYWPLLGYFNVFNEASSGKPTFLPTRIPESPGPGGTVRRSYSYPAWRLAPQFDLSSLEIARLCHGEKGVHLDGLGADENPLDPADPSNFLAPLRLFQKDADFDHLAELLEVPMWGPLVDRCAYALELAPPTFNFRRTWATLPEILAQRVSDRQRLPDSRLFFPKFVRPIQGFPDGSAEYGRDQHAYNRLSLDPAQYDPVAANNVNNVQGTLWGAQVLPPRVQPGTDPAQNGVGFNVRLPAGSALLDAFTIDDRGAKPLDDFNGTTPPNGVIDYVELAGAEDRRLRLARGFEGKLTPGLINLNTAPVEVLRAMPLMTRLVYDDDFPIARSADSNSANLNDRDSVIGRRRTVRDWLAADDEPLYRDLFEASPADYLLAEGASPNPALPFSISFDGGVPAPRVRIPESIDLWRSRTNVVPATTANPDGSPPTPLARLLGMPTYARRGLELPQESNHLEWAPGMRRERGFESVGELALLLRGAEFVREPAPDSDGNNDPDVREIAANQVLDLNRNGIKDGSEPGAAVGGSWNRALSWSRLFAGLDPFRTRWDAPVSGRGVFVPGPHLPVVQAAGGLPYRTEGVPAALAAGVPQQYPLTGRTAVDKHLLVVARDNPLTAPVETDDPDTPDSTLPDGTEVPWREPAMYRYDQTATDAIERNSLLKAVSNIATVRSDVFTAWVRIRTIRQDPLTGRWPGMDPEYIVDDSRYVMTIDRSSVDRPGEAPRILSFVKVQN